MKYVRTPVVLVSIFALCCSPAAAQWQAPKYSVPLGRGGGASGFDSASPGATGGLLVSNGPTTNPTFTLFTTIVNNVCTLAPTPCAYLYGYVRPEWFGASCSFVGTSASTIADATTAIRAAVTWAAGNGGGTVKLSSCAYKVTAPINVAANNIAIRGTGFNQTIVVHAPAAPSPAFNFSAGAAILSNVEISDLSIQGGDTTTLKQAIRMSDVSVVHVHDVFITNYNTGGLYRGGGGSTGIATSGRELGVVQRMEIYAEQPIQISVNPNVPSTGEDMDSWVWRDLLLVGQQSGAVRHDILVDNGVSFYNTHFEGHQNWIGGVDGFHWVNGGAVISEGLYISGVKDEQPGAIGTGWTFNIQQLSSTLYNFTVTDTTPAVRGGFLLRGVANTTLRGVMLDPNPAGSTKIGMDADLTNNLIDFRGCAWLAGTTATLGAFTAGGVVHPAGFSTALPASGVLYQ